MKNFAFLMVCFALFMAGAKAETVSEKAFAVAVVKVKNPEKMAKYVSMAKPLIEKHGGKIIAKGSVSDVLAGQFSGEFVAVAEFPNVSAIDAFYHSHPYQAIIPLRDEAADVVFFTITSPRAR